MIRLIVGTKGSGKTKAMIDMINESVRTSKGSVVVVEKGMKLTYDISSAARLIDSTSIRSRAARCSTALSQG